MKTANIFINFMIAATLLSLGNVSSASCLNVAAADSNNYQQCFDNEWTATGNFFGAIAAGYALTELKNHVSVDAPSAIVLGLAATTTTANALCSHQAAEINRFVILVNEGYQGDGLHIREWARAMKTSKQNIANILVELDQHNLICNGRYMSSSDIRKLVKDAVSDQAQENTLD